jgi:hypothetical protein
MSPFLYPAQSQLCFLTDWFPANADHVHESGRNEETPGRYKVGMMNGGQNDTQRVNEYKIAKHKSLCNPPKK